MANYGWTKLELVEKPAQEGLHEIQGVSLTPYINPDTGEVFVYVIDYSGLVLKNGRTNG